MASSSAVEQATNTDGVAGEIATAPQHVGVVGLGRMGHAFAANLVSDGYSVSIYDRDPRTPHERQKALVQTGRADHIADIARTRPTPISTRSRPSSTRARRSRSVPAPAVRGPKTRWSRRPGGSKPRWHTHRGKESVEHNNPYEHDRHDRRACSLSRYPHLRRALFLGRISPGANSI
jgi:hypothetical protein